jgi:hypothetical protein
MVAVLRSSWLDTRLVDEWEGCQVPLSGGSSHEEGKKGGLYSDKGGLRSASSGAQAMGTGGGQ